MTGETAVMSKGIPAVGTRGKCERCGRTVWLKKMGTMGQLSRHPGQPVYEWVARKGTKPRPIECPVSDGFPFTHHTAEGYKSRYYGAAS